MSSSVTASQQALDDLVDPARIKKGWNKHDERWAETARVSLKTLQRFWSRKFIRRANFIAICQAIDIDDWKAIADLSSQSQQLPMRDQKPEKLSDDLALSISVKNSFTDEVTEQFLLKDQQRRLMYQVDEREQKIWIEPQINYLPRLTNIDYVSGFGDLATDPHFKWQHPNLDLRIVNNSKKLYILLM